MKRHILIDAKTRDIIEYKVSNSRNDLEQKLGKDYKLGKKYKGALCYISKPRRDENYFFAIGEDKFGGRGVFTGWPTGVGLSSCDISVEYLKENVQFLKFVSYRKPK